MMTAMTPERFETLLQSYGALREHWPAAERAGLDARLAESPEARAAWRAAARLDALLQAAPAPAPSAALTRRVENLVTALPARRARWWRRAKGSRTTRILRPALIAASGVLGIGIGIAAAPQQPVAPLYETVDVTAISGGAIGIRIAEILEDQQ